MHRILAVVAVAVAVAAPLAPAGAQTDDLRVATYNVSLFRGEEGELVEDLATPDDPQAQAVAAVIQLVRPDVLLVNEFDYDADGRAVNLFAENYLEAGAAPIEYPYRMAFASNTGVPSGFDLDNNGVVGEEGRAYGDDALGFGEFPGQYAFAVYSRYPILEDELRTFQEFLWGDMPDALLPPDFFSTEELDIVRLSSKNHVDVPIDVDGEVLHLLASHPTPPAFDGPEDRNGRRNFDEIRFWADYVQPDQSGYIYDDEGRRGGLDEDVSFVVAGDLNADPVDGDSLPGAIEQLLELDVVREDPPPTSAGAVAQAELQGGANRWHDGPAATDTADFNDAPAPGNLRVDYVLPSADLGLRSSGVFWPLPDDDDFDLVGTFPFPSSDHRLVWIDVAL